MSKWRFIITLEGEDDLGRLDAKVRARIINKLGWLIDNFDNVLPLPLSGPWRGFFKLRVGEWRIIYEVEHNRRLVTVHQVGFRDKIYK